jgi:uncharacterized protein (TIRG00374 family)
MIQSQQRVSFRSSFSAVAIGQLLNNLLPARLGGLGRAFVLHREEGISISFSLATIVVERVLDVLVIMVCLVISLPLFHASALMIQTAYIGGSLLVVMLIGLLLAVRWERLVINCAVRVLDRFSASVAKRSEDIMTSFFAGLRIIKDRSLLPVLMFSALAWIVSAFALNLLVRSMGGSISFGGATFVVALLGVAMMIPASPGALGPYEFFAISALVLLGLERTQAASMALLTHLVVYIVTIGLGVLSLWGLGLNLGQLTASLTKAERPGVMTPEERCHSEGI